ncbi:hypothetical protein M8818_001403 [Zalaria obscura]|uniref:Uncharacterized protein n=1 Tax=Zalaria obscura TaxID=2024903 RepID=A0ACC3SKM9_9PEZI
MYLPLKVGRLALGNCLIQLPNIGNSIQCEPSTFAPWISPEVSGVSLDAAGLVALADFTTIARRTALTGTSTFLDAFVLCPGLHRQQNAPELNGGEYPTCAAMTTGYVFRVENPATVLYLQKVGRTGQLTTLSVRDIRQTETFWSRTLSLLHTTHRAALLTTVPYFGAICLTLWTLVLLVLTADWWGLTVIVILIFSRFCNIIVIRRRSITGWKGASEPGVQGDLLILLSQDRWIRLRGTVDDLKAVTSGQWLREPTFFEGSVAALATVLVYLDAALASNTYQLGKILLLVLLISSAGLLAITNEKTEVLQMHGKLIQVDGKRKKYDRRLTMAEELIRETGRQDWAVRLGMIVPKRDEKVDKKDEGPVPKQDEKVDMQDEGPVIM